MTCPDLRAPRSTSGSDHSLLPSQLTTAADAAADDAGEGADKDADEEEEDEAEDADAEDGGHGLAGVRKRMKA